MIKGRRIQGAVERQPPVDSSSAPGYRVSDASGNLIDYSRNCSINTIFTPGLPARRQGGKGAGAARHLAQPPSFDAVFP